MKKCPECGDTEIPGTVYYGVGGWGWWVTCEYCGGSGEVWDKEDDMPEVQG